MVDKLSGVSEKDTRVRFSDQVVAGTLLVGMGLGGLVFGIAGLGYEGSAALWRAGKNVIDSTARPLSSSLTRRLSHH